MLLYYALFALHAKVVPYLNVQLEGASLSNRLFDKTSQLPTGSQPLTGSESPKVSPS